MRRNRLSALFILCAVSCLVTACHDKESPDTLFPLSIVHTQDKTETAFQVELADDPAEQEHGLMGRQDLADDRGMIFVFPQSKVTTFWMHNTPLFLDMVFIDDTGTVTQIHRNARPFDETLISSKAPVRAVLEIKGGNAQRQNIAVGDTIKPLFW